MRSGILPNDLSNYLLAQGTTAGALNAHPRTLQNLITDFNTTANAFARENVALRNTVVQLPRTLSAAIPAFNALNAAFPPLEKLAVTLIPGVKSTGPTIDASLPFITQLRLLVQPVGAAGAGQRPQADDPLAREADQRDDPADEESRSGRPRAASPT